MVFHNAVFTIFVDCRVQKRARNGFSPHFCAHVGQLFDRRYVMKLRYADRTSRMNSAVVKETLKLTAIPGIISFAGGMPAPEVFPVEEMKQAMVKVMEKTGAQALQYGPTNGILPLREKIAKRLNEKENINCTADNILMVSGSQQALDLSGKIFLNPGDIVVTENPTYTAALSSLGVYECDFISVESDDDGMILEDLEKKLASSDRIRLIYVIPSFQNPTGRTWSPERRKGLYELACKYDLPIIEDNPYGELRYEGEGVPSVKSMDTEGRVVYLGSFSKILSPGTRLGWICACPELLEKYDSAKQGADLQANTVMQYVVNQYMEDNDLDANVVNLNALYKSRRDLMISMIDSEFPEGTVYTRPQGGLFLWVQVPGNVDTAELMKEVVKSNVAYLPGFSFFPNGGPANCMRLNFSNAKEDKIVEGMKLLGKALRDAM